MTCSECAADAVMIFMLGGALVAFVIAVSYSAFHDCEVALKKRQGAKGP